MPCVFNVLIFNSRAIMIPIVSDLLTQPGVMVGMGLGICVGFFARASMFGDSADPSANLEDEDDDNWDEDGFLAEGTGETKLVLVVRSDLKMGKGKAAAQCCHATLKAFKQLQKTNRRLLRAWEMNGQPKVVLKIDDEESMLDLASLAREVGLTVSLIQDAGRTQIAPGSRTVLGVGPGPVDLVDQITGHLKLF
ncbi:peptidyl-tRNA hydrolase 2, mitochondrial-like isoform X1 [Macrobrachium rosenbergii]|uniref:peptidyl-tRNA hydrolase 2, mitochondrial-like isoform X1 n=1 Tax=Macrobrachium rosenbergii TaxID=79674 RepID=UPI0034D60DAF